MNKKITSLKVFKSPDVYICIHISTKMKNSIWALALTSLSLVSCHSAFNIAHVNPAKNTPITSELPEQAAMKKLIEPYKLQMESKMNEVISHTSVELNKTGDNSNLGNLLADFTLEGAQDWAKDNGNFSIDAAVINIGGIRSIIGAGNITTKQVFEVMPFENEVIIVKMNGSDLQGLFDYYLKTQKNNPVSKLFIETENGKIIQAKVNGQVVNHAKTYYIATSDYLAMGGDNMKFFSKGELIPTGIKLRELFLEHFKKHPEINAPTDVRLIFKNKND